MIKTDECFTETFRIGKYECRMTVGSGGIVAEWEPELTPHCLNRTEVREYKKCRNRLLKRFADKIGHKVLVVDI